jgi:hypothetical protein
MPTKQVVRAVKSGRIRVATKETDGFDRVVIRNHGIIVYVKATSKAAREFDRYLARFELHAEQVSEGLDYWCRADGGFIAYVGQDEVCPPLYYEAGKERRAERRSEPTAWHVIGDDAEILARLTNEWYVDGRAHDVCPVRVTGQAAGGGELSEGAKRRMRVQRELRLKDAEAKPSERQADEAFLRSLPLVERAAVLARRERELSYQAETYVPTGDDETDGRALAAIERKQKQLEKLAERMLG